jgi:AcrR family transcriptional regulator
MSANEVRALVPAPTGQTAPRRALQERAVVTREAVLRAAALLFEEQGYTATSIGDVARVGGRTSGSVYFHFGSKEGLARALAEAYHERWPPLIERRMALHAPVLVRLIALHLAVARAYRDDVLVRAGARLWFERGAVPTPLPAPFAGWIAVTEGLLVQAVQAGELAPGTDCGQVARLLVSAFFGTHTVDDALGERADLTDHVLVLWRLLLPGVGVAEPEALLAAAQRLDALAGTEEEGTAPLRADADR